MRDALGLGHLGTASDRPGGYRWRFCLPQRAADRRGRGRFLQRGTPQVTRLLIIVQNLPVPFDRRVWLECQVLTSAGYHVAVVCPKGQ